MLRAAACAKPRGRESAKGIARARISVALRWMRAVLDDSALAAPRMFWVDDPGEGPTIAFEASLTGGVTYLEAGRGDPIRHVVMGRTREGAAAWQAEWLAPSAQPLWEAFALLAGTCTWHHLLGERCGRLRLRGDAKGALQAVARKRAHHAGLNRVVAEMLCRAMRDVEVAHFWPELNAEADALSRVHEGAEVPQRLAQTGIRDAPVCRCPWRILG